MTITISHEEYEGWSGTLEQRVAAFAAALVAHASTVDQPRPTEHELVELLVRSGGMSALTVLPPNVPVPPPQQTLPEARAWAVEVVNRAAENTRAMYITVGDGQAMVYIRKEAEARQFALLRPLNPAPGTYPLLEAELAAQHAVGNSAMTLGDVTDEVLEQANLWVEVGATIERQRRERVLAIGLAQTVNEVIALSSWTWP